jgi:GTP-binding protein HflX
MAELYDTQKAQERVILVAVDMENPEFDVESCLDELEELASTAGAQTVGRMVQRREGVHRAHYLGKGKLEELKAYIEMQEATGIICDDELTPAQIRNMSQALDTKVMDRTLLILDIFASRASSAEGKVQVELAQLRYSLTHLTGQGKYMSRQGGGIGTRGPGEKKLETDRRIIADRIAELNRELKDIERHREVMREKRLKSKIPVAALVGYTNAGKSTLMNYLTGAGVLAEDKLFATLDTTTRRVETEGGISILFTDTVGFIQKLPHGLIKAFRATLEEASYADILVHVVDASNPAREEQMRVVYNTLNDLKCGDKPVVTVFNKTDLPVDLPLPGDKLSRVRIPISAKTGVGVDKLVDEVQEIAKEFKHSIRVLIPYAKGAVLGVVHSCEVTVNESREDGYYFELFADEETENRLREFIVE